MTKLTINGTLIDDSNTAIGVVANGATMQSVYINGIKVFSKKAPAGSQTFTSSGTFTVPQGYDTVTICMCGGGGGGSYLRLGYDYPETVGGGYAGAVVSKVVSGLTEGQSISVTIGSGGGTEASGGTSSFGTYASAGGGLGGTYGSANYGGNGASRATCGGTFNDGSLYITGLYNTKYIFGGQAGGFGNGATSAGAAANAAANSGAGGAQGGSGGSGRCVVSWS